MPNSRYDYPHTIENGAGERLIFRRRVPGATGDRVEGDNVTLLGTYRKYADAPEPIRR
jgi:hypothetical protein